MIPDQAMASLQNLEVLVLGALRYSRITLTSASRKRFGHRDPTAERPISHICVTKWTMPSFAITRGVQPAYDGLVVDV